MSIFACLVGLLIGLLVALQIAIGWRLYDLRARARKPVLLAQPMPDYKRIAWLEHEHEFPIERVVAKAEGVAERYMTTNRHLLYDTHPHVRDYGWPPELPR